MPRRDSVAWPMEVGGTLGGRSSSAAPMGVEECPAEVAGGGGGDAGGGAQGSGRLGGREAE